MRFALTGTAALILTAALFGLTGCKSKDKQADSSKPAAAPAAPKDAKAAAKDTKKEGASATSSDKIECKLGGDTRLLEVRGKDKGCDTAYTKAGQENVVGSSQNGTAHCEGIVTRIKDKLTAAGFTCN
jgi:hypothetical protein